MRLFGMNAKGPYTGRLSKRWKGPKRLVIAIDIGATCTSVAVAFLEPGESPTLLAVSGWPGPGQDAALKEERLPTLVAYDSLGNLRGCGFEAETRPANVDERNWTLVRNFKLRLHSMRTSPTQAPILDPHSIIQEALTTQLPLKKIYVDFMGYVLRHTQNHMEKHDIEYDHSKLDLILTHPNGWEPKQQQFLLDAAVAAGMVRDNYESRSRVYFAEEGQAAARYCISDCDNVWTRSMKKGSSFIICDAGGSTIDISAYDVQSCSPEKITLQELRASCIATGGLLIDDAFKQHLVQAFDTSYRRPEEIDSMITTGVQNFHISGKRRFESKERGGIEVAVAHAGIHDSNLGIAFGLLTIPGDVMSAFFARCVDPMIHEVWNQTRIHPNDPIKYIILTGGVGDSQHVRHRLLAEFRKDEGYKVIISNHPSNKTVAIGALMLAVDGGDVVFNQEQRAYHSPESTPWYRRFFR